MLLLADGHVSLAHALSLHRFMQHQHHPCTSPLTKLVLDTGLNSCLTRTAPLLPQVRSDLETLLLPLLRMLYSASSRTPSQMYMLLIIILILSQDTAFAQNIHRIAVPAVPWYKERMLVKTSLGAALCTKLLSGWCVEFSMARLSRPNILCVQRIQCCIKQLAEQLCQFPLTAADVLATTTGSLLSSWPA